MASPGELRQQLRDACYRGELRRAEQLIEQGAPVQVDGASSVALYRSAFGGAIYGRQLEAVRMLLRRGLVLEGRLAECALVTACESLSIEIVRLLLEHAPATAKDEDGYTALMAATAGASLEIMRMLLGRGADVHAKVSQNGFTALHYAARMRFDEGYALLVEHGADEHAESLPQHDIDEEFDGCVWTPRALLDCVHQRSQPNPGCENEDE